MPGPPRKPTPTLRLAGSWRGEARAKTEPTPPAGEPERPDWLDADGREAWDRLLPILMDMRILTAADGAALALLCDTWARYRKASRMLADFGDVYTVKNPDGSPRMIRRSPYSAIQAELARILRGQLAEFGLTPASRSKTVALPGASDHGKASLFTRRPASA